MRSTPATRSLIDALVGEACSFCESGTLARGTYKDNEAAVCDTCGTPALQRF